METQNNEIVSGVRRNFGALRPSSPAETSGAFTLIELVVVLALLGVMCLLLVPALSSTTTTSAASQCRNNLRQTTLAWRQWSDENNGFLLSSAGAILGAEMTAVRPNWMTGALDYVGSSRSNWDTNQDIVRSPLWKYCGRSAGIFKCPSDSSAVVLAGISRPRVRSYSMSHAFGQGEWLDKNYNTSQSVWRTYSRASDIMRPAQTFLFVDVHPDSINDSSFKNACTGAQPADPPTAAQLIDYPSPLHNGAGNLSFADGRVETHRWQGSKIRNCLVRYDFMSLNVPAETSWMDVRWIAERTTARR